MDRPNFFRPSFYHSLIHLSSFPVLLSAYLLTSLERKKINVNFKLFSVSGVQEMECRFSLLYCHVSSFSSFVHEQCYESAISDRPYYSLTRLPLGLIRDKTLVVICLFISRHITLQNSSSVLRIDKSPIGRITRLGKF